MNKYLHVRDMGLRMHREAGLVCVTCGDIVGNRYLYYERAGESVHQKVFNHFVCPDCMGYKLLVFSAS